MEDATKRMEKGLKLHRWKEMRGKAKGRSEAERKRERVGAKKETAARNKRGSWLGLRHLCFAKVVQSKGFAPYSHFYSP
jgi:hypothetical protein